MYHRESGIELLREAFGKVVKDAKPQQLPAPGLPRQLRILFDRRVSCRERSCDTKPGIGAGWAEPKDKSPSKEQSKVVITTITGTEEPTSEILTEAKSFK